MLVTAGIKHVSDIRMCDDRRTAGRRIGQVKMQVLAFGHRRCGRTATDAYHFPVSGHKLVYQPGADHAGGPRDERYGACNGFVRAHQSDSKSK